MQQKQTETLIWVIAGVALTSPLFLVFAAFGEPGKGRAAWMCAGVFLIVAKVRWDLRHQAWFWWTMAALLALHLPLVLLVPWTSKWIPAALIFPILVPDLVLIFVCIRLVEKWNGSKQISNETVQD